MLSFRKRFQQRKGFSTKFISLSSDRKSVSYDWPKEFEIGNLKVSIYCIKDFLFEIWFEDKDSVSFITLKKLEKSGLRKVYEGLRRRNYKLPSFEKFADAMKDNFEKYLGVTLKD